MAGLTLRYRVERPVILEGHRNKPAELVLASDEDAFRTPPLGGVPDRYSEDASGQIKDSLVRLYLAAGLGMSQIPPGTAGGEAGEREVCRSLLRLFPHDPVLDKQQKMDGWNFFSFFF